MCIEGDEPSIDEILEEISRIAEGKRRFGFSREDIEDLAQEAYMALMMLIAQDTFPPDDGDWRRSVRATVTNVAQNRGRKERRRRHSALANVPDPAAMDDRFERFELTEDLYAAMAELAPEDRQLLIDYYFDGQTYQMIADAQGCRPSTIHYQIHRAHKALRAILMA